MLATVSVDSATVVHYACLFAPSCWAESMAPMFTHLACCCSKIEGQGESYKLLHSTVAHQPLQYLCQSIYPQARIQKGDCIISFAGQNDQNPISVWHCACSTSLLVAVQLPLKDEEVALLEPQVQSAGKCAQSLSCIICAVFHMPRCVVLALDVIHLGRCRLCWHGRFLCHVNGH